MIACSELREKNETFPWLPHLWCHLCCIFYSLPFRFLSELIPFIAYSSPIGFPAAHFTITAWITSLYLGQPWLCSIFAKAMCSLLLMSELQYSKRLFSIAFMKMEDSLGSFVFKISWFCLFFSFRLDLCSLPCAAVWSLGYGGVGRVRTCVIALPQNRPLTALSPDTSHVLIIWKSLPCKIFGYHWNQSWHNDKTTYSPRLGFCFGHCHFCTLALLM